MLVTFEEMIDNTHVETAHALLSVVTDCGMTWRIPMLRELLCSVLGNVLGDE